MTTSSTSARAVRGVSLRGRIGPLASAVLLAAVIVPARAQPASNEDTGLGATQCIDAGSEALVACASATLTGQDGQVGRDTVAGSNGDADGLLGFSFTKMCNSGEAAGTGTCPPDPPLGSKRDDWGCTRDDLTGMWWEVKTKSGARSGALLYTNYSRAYDPLGEYGSSTDATGYANRVNAEGLCGQDDWGLGHSSKLQTALDYGIVAPAPLVDPAFFPHMQALPYWNASENPSLASSAWAMDFGSGRMDNDGDRGLLRPVILVRGKPALGTGSSYTISPDGTMTTDTSPGATISWRRCVEGMTWNGAACVGTPQSFTVDQALEHAAAVAAATGQPWHVPNVKELNWTVRREYTSPSIDRTEFPDTPAGFYCTSTPNVDAPVSAWVVDFSVGRVLTRTRNKPCYLRLAL